MKTKINLLSFYAFLFFATTNLFAVSSGKLEVVSPFLIEKYLGTWHEIARFENKHQKGCVKTTATYSKKNSKELEIINQCTTKDNKIKTSKGLAKIPDEKVPAKLKVNFTPRFIRFFGIGWGNYWIIELGENYKYAVVSEPKKSSLWILSRTDKLDRADFEKIISRLEEKGFATNKLVISETQLQANSGKN
jgi:apolipoprotein D and lipocalin family protein